MRKFGLLAEGEVEELEALGERVQADRLTRAADDDVLGDVPDDFLDPFTCELMTDPVLLPRQCAALPHLLRSPGPAKRPPSGVGNGLWRSAPLATAEMGRAMPGQGVSVSELTRSQRTSRCRNRRQVWPSTCSCSGTIWGVRRSHPPGDRPLCLHRGAGEQISMDRASITRHLLSNTTDPFNKQPLSADQLVPHTELKAKIEAWKAAQRAAGAQPMQP